jgi:N-acetylmuramoyl-L-alanine amidase
MYRIIRTNLYKFFIAIIVLNVFGNIQAQDKKFVVVIDAGHGGHDTGTRGTGKMKKREKDIALAVAKSVYQKLKTQPGIKPILTRDKDIFLKLYQRAEIANKHKADLFVSIHCNANKSSRANGSETFVLGIHRNKDNLEVAKRENAVIKLEDDNQFHYEGFDPEHPETFIGLTLMQEEFLDQSIMLASLIQDAYKKNVPNIKDRSVQQAGFAVLRLTYMPSVLTEIGFLSNPKEEKYLNSKTGQNKIAQAIAQAIVSYKNYIKYNTPDPQTSIKVKETTTANSQKIYEGVIFKVQLAAAKKKIDLKPQNFKGLTDLSMIKVGKWYKYYTGKTSDYNQILKIKDKAKQKGYKTAFVVAYKNGKRISLSELLKK